MLNTAQPIVFISEGSDCIKDHPTVINPKSPLETCAIFDEISYWGAPLGDIFGLKNPFSWPVDIARIWSGSIVNTEHILQSINHIRGDLAETKTFILNDLAKNLSFDTSKEKPFFFLDAQRIPKEGFWRDYVRILNLTSIRILQSFNALLQSGSDEESMRDFFATLEANHRMTQYLGTATKVLDSMCRFLIKEGYRVNESVGASAKMEGIGKGGHVVYVFPSGEMSDRMNFLIEKLRSETHKDICLDWASWLDGWDSERV